MQIIIIQPYSWCAVTGPLIYGYHLDSDIVRRTIFPELISLLILEGLCRSLRCNSHSVYVFDRMLHAFFYYL